MATKKATESFIKKTAGELAVGDRFRPVGSPPWQEVVSLEKQESEQLNLELNTKKEIVSCMTKVEGSIEEFRFTSFSNIEVEVLDG